MADLVLWFLRLFTQFRELEDRVNRYMYLHAYSINPGGVGSEAELERDLYRFLAERIPLGVQLVVLPTEESAQLEDGTVAAQLVVPRRRR